MPVNSMIRTLLTKYYLAAFLLLLLCPIVYMSVLVWRNLHGNASNDWFALSAVLGIYALAHLFRMLRLAMLTLDRRAQLFPLLCAHALTALPSAMLPFKIGELLRLGGFFVVFKDHKALAVWLAERFGDISVISLFVLALYLFEVEVPNSLRLLFVVFFVSSVLALMSFFSITGILTYLNRYLVLSSYSVRGLLLLKASHRLRQLEATIYHSFKGRFVGICLISIFIWVAEMTAIVLFLRTAATHVGILSDYFPIALLGVLGISVEQNNYELYQWMLLSAIAVLFAALLFTGRYLSTTKH